MDNVIYPADARADLERMDIQHRELARINANAFVTYVLRDEETGRPILSNQAQEEWHDLFEQNPRLLVWAHIESGKTQQMSIARTLYELGRDPSLRVAVVSNTDQQAQKICLTIQKYIEHSDALHAVFPNLKRAKDMPWNQHELYVQRSDGAEAKDPSVRTCGIHGNILGARIDLLILDDLLDYENTVSPTRRSDLWDWYHATLEGRLTKRARVLCIGTAWHREDIMHRFAKQKAWHFKRYPVLDENTGLSHWPERWSDERISAKRETAGPLEFSRQMLCVARSDEDARFKRAWIDQCLKRGLGRTPTYALNTLPPGYKTYTGVDLGVGESANAAVTSLCTIVVHPNGDREVLNVEAGRWAGPEIVEKIIDHHHRYQSIVLVENNACFAPGTRVLTPAGYVPIERIKAGDEVWTHMGRWRQVTETHVGASRTLVTARAKGCLPVRCTPNHWFYMRRAGRVPGRGGGQHRPVGPADWISYGVRDVPAYTAVAAPKWPELPAMFVQKATLREPDCRTPVSENLALVLGLFMAEGHTTRGQAHWTFGAQESYLADLVEREISKVTDRLITRSYGRGTLRVTANSTRLANALRIGKGPNKCLPMHWMGWPLETRLALVRGWLLGDGCARRNNGRSKTPSWYVGGVTISRNWALFVRATLAEAGMHATMRRSLPDHSVIEGRRVHRREIFELTLSWADSTKLRAYMTSCEEFERWANWWRQDCGSKAQQHGTIIRDGVCLWSRVPDIEASPYEAYDGLVHNLTVADDASYTVEDFVVHNAQEFIVQFTRKTSAVPVVSFTTGRNKAHPEFGIEGLATEMSNAKWILPSQEVGGHLRGATADIEALANELLYYDPQGHPGDRLMSAWFAREGARRSKPKIKFGHQNLTAR